MSDDLAKLLEQNNINAKLLLMM